MLLAPWEVIHLCEDVEGCGGRRQQSGSLAVLPTFVRGPGAQRKIQSRRDADQRARRTYSKSAQRDPCIVRATHRRKTPRRCLQGGDVFKSQQIDCCEPPDLILLVQVFEITLHSFTTKWWSLPRGCGNAVPESPRDPPWWFRGQRLCRPRRVLWFLSPCHHRRHLRRVEALAPSGWWFGR